MFDKTEQIALFAYLESLFDDKLQSVWTSQPATILNFNALENTVSCVLDRENIVLEDIPISLFGNTQSYITTPTMEKGTKGLLIFSKHDLYIWVESGMDSEAKTDFSKNNAFFLIGVTNQKNKISYNMDAIEIKTDKAVEIFADIHTKIEAPKIALKNSNTNEELFALLVETLNEMKDLATTLTQSQLINSIDIVPFVEKFDLLSSKYGSFIE